MVSETITESEIWKDLDAQFMLPLRQPGDIDAYQFIARYGCNESNARKKMSNLVSTGEWEFVTVADDTTSQGRRKVIRKVK